MCIRDSLQLIQELLVIAPGSIADFCPTYFDPQSDSLMTQFDKDDVETIGLVKFDFLGLRTLTVIDRAVKTINQSLSEKNEKTLDLNSLTLDDPKVFDLLASGRTTAVFQLESTGMRELIRRLKPTKFEEIVALLALYRPGPCLLYTSPSPRDATLSRMPSSA